MQSVLRSVLELYNIESEQIHGAIISSVVPQLVNVIKSAVEKIIGITPLIVGPGVKTGLNLLMDQPKQVGTDMVVDAVAAIHEYGAPVLIIDVGTATTISAVDNKKNYVGGAILPGIRVSVDSLVSRTAQLPRISLEAPKSVIGKNTIACMQSGAVYGECKLYRRHVVESSERTVQNDGCRTGTGQSHCNRRTGKGDQVPYCHNEIILDDKLL